MPGANPNPRRGEKGSGPLLLDLGMLGAGGEVGKRRTRARQGRKACVYEKRSGSRLEWVAFKTDSYEHDPKYNNNIYSCYS